MRRQCFERAVKLGLFTFLFLAGFFVSASDSFAGTFNIIHQFCTPDGCSDGGSSTAPLLADSSGNLYGTAGGGTQNNGIVYEMSPGTKNAWNYQILYSFCALTNCADGSFPEGQVIIDKKGNLYGTTYFGGASNKGVAFELVYKKGAPYTLKVLYNFCSQASCADGENPGNGFAYQGSEANAPYDGKSPLFSTTFEGGPYGNGLVFSLSAHGGGNGSWAEKTVHAFCAGGGLCSDGALPVNSLLFDSKGNLYGSTAGGGVNGSGEVFELSPKGKKWKETLLYSFCSQPDCADGGGGSSLVFDGSGDIYGAVDSGGLPNCGGAGCGVAYKLTPSGKTYKFTQLYSFCSQPNCTDGYTPNGNLVLDASGNLFGDTFSGGSNSFEQHGGGVLFESSGTNYQVLHTFCISPCDDGGNSTGGVVSDTSGNLYGTTANYGNPGGGTIFEWSP
jgi:uncharacterized repeat protein (TIGR03803 family)